jgi:toxin ParE1/3/4
VSQHVISDEAIQDLKEISDYFWTNNIEAGEQFLRAFDARCRQLVQFPQMGRSYSHVRPGILGLPLRGFVILYRVGSSEDIKIEILRVVSGRRELENVFSED